MRQRHFAWSSTSKSTKLYVQTTSNTNYHYTQNRNKPMNNNASFQNNSKCFHGTTSSKSRSTFTNKPESPPNASDYSSVDAKSQHTIRNRRPPRRVHPYYPLRSAARNQSQSQEALKKRRKSCLRRHSRSLASRTNPLFTCNATQPTKKYPLYPTDIRQCCWNAMNPAPSTRSSSITARTACTTTCGHRSQAMVRAAPIFCATTTMKRSRVSSHRMKKLDASTIHAVARILSRPCIPASSHRKVICVKSPPT
mmetsp:Transcript_3087/g.5221  ORF Transcript_3087/g.5221 Transcript_3087/m.5221 type:complete len:252 (-) Transcript_3087:686-1441(-)